MSSKLNHKPDRLTGLAKLLRNIPSSPGVYLMKNAEDQILYVGKARNLKKRLGSYQRAPGKQDLKTQLLVKKIKSVDTITTSSEKEALILESNLIKRHKPRYNVVLKDDKRYPVLRFDIKHPYPSLSIVRKMNKDGALYFGPFSSAHAVRETLKFINKTFKLRKCKEREFKTRTRPCLHCQMQGCLAPCCSDIDRAVYNEMVKEVVLFLKGRTPDLIQKIEKEMLDAAAKQDYERAAQLRDKMVALSKTIERQVVVSADLKDRDVIALVNHGGWSLITLMVIRGGYLLGMRHFQFSETLANASEIMETFIRQYYAEAQFIPKEILISVKPNDLQMAQERLGDIKKEKIQLHHPQRGSKAKLLQMASQNAIRELQERLALRAKEQDLLQQLQRRLRMQRLPKRIECFDNSNLSGALPVASRVVFIDGRPHKSAYRHYKIQKKGKPDDYGNMREILTRRFTKSMSPQKFPDLLMVDGGKGQLNIAMDVLREMGFDTKLTVIAIAKPDAAKGETGEKIYLPGRKNPMVFSKNADVLHLLQRVRDEAHRFAITFHRKQRKSKTLQSRLDEIPGIGKARKEALLRHFKSIKKIRAATADEISVVPGISRNLAGTVEAHIKKR